jgi:hypothetical protein
MARAMGSMMEYRRIIELWEDELPCYKNQSQVYVWYLEYSYNVKLVECFDAFIVFHT